MTASIFALFSLCLALTVHGIPVRVKISPPAPHVDEIKPVHQGANPQQRGGGLEGDMIFPKGYNPKSSTRGVAIYGNNQWPNGIIPYDISAITNANDRQMITNAMLILMYAVGTPIPGSDERSACVYFRPRQSTDRTYFKIVYGNGCSANVGYLPQYQSKMTLQQDGCFYYGTIQHELMHVLGFFHEQSRPDRDNFLEVHLENVEPDMRFNFDKYAWGSTVLNQGSKYDYASVMHYETTAFSTNGRPTMIPRRAGVTIGDAQELSPTDIAEVRHFYGCTA
jgi:hypothetical protein